MRKDIESGPSHACATQRDNKQINIFKEMYLMCHSLFILSFLWIDTKASVTRAAASMAVQASLWCAYIALHTFSGVLQLHPTAALFFRFLRDLWTDFHGSCPSLHFHHQGKKGPLSTSYLSLLF